ncbi:FtsX-like permease family protein [Sphingomonas sp. MMS12-HWE2-04]|uniref:FtsX-like permease family protein n=1 Tax=Sphingomonas sp. MMS12-HWE2-04 TaxID=3234199 RepID=UPI00384C4F28
MTTLSWLALGLMVLIATATAAIVLLAARSGLDTHRDTIEVLHMLGSTDVQVARLFQRRIALDTLLGGVAGTLGALLLVALLQSRMGTIGSEMLSGVALQQRDWFVLLLLPLAFALLATIAARLAVLRALERAL